MTPAEACQQKRHYVTRAHAREACRRIKRETHRHVRPYRCPCCDGYHLTSVKDLQEYSEINLVEQAEEAFLALLRYVAAEEDREIRFTTYAEGVEQVLTHLTTLKRQLWTARQESESQEGAPE